MPVPPPNLTSRPLQLSFVYELAVSPDVVFRACTENLDQWLAAPGTLILTPAVDTAFFFETHHGDFRAPYYGRIVRLEQDRLLELTWLSIGTRGMETLLTLELEPTEAGTLMQLTHTGFPDEELRDAHDAAWRELLVGLGRKYLMV